MTVASRFRNVFCWNIPPKLRSRGADYLFANHSTIKPEVKYAYEDELLL